MDAPFFWMWSPAFLSLFGEHFAVSIGHRYIYIEWLIISFDCVYISILTIFNSIPFYARFQLFVPYYLFHI